MLGGVPLRTLVVRLIDDTKAYALAEVAVVRATVTSWLAPAKVAVPLFVAALFLLQAALTVLVAALGMTIAIWLGPAGGLAVGGVIVLLLAALLAALGIRTLQKGGR